MPALIAPPVRADANNAFEGTAEGLDRTETADGGYTVDKTGGIFVHELLGILNAITIDILIEVHSILLIDMT